MQIDFINQDLFDIQSLLKTNRKHCFHNNIKILMFHITFKLAFLISDVISIRV